MMGAIERLLSCTINAMRRPGNILKDLRLTVITAAFAVAMIAAAALTDINIVQLNLNFLQNIEKNELDELLSVIVIIMAALFIDLWLLRKRRQAEIEAEKLRILKATMRTVQDIVNNFLNNLLLFEMEVKSKVPPHTLDQLDELSLSTYEKLKALGDLEQVQESALAIGAGIELPPTAQRREGQQGAEAKH
jgi:hypothetical protein